MEAGYPELIGNVEGGKLIKASVILYHFTTGLYPPPLHAQYIAQLTSIMWIGGIFLMIGGSSIFSTLGIAEPAFYQFMKENQGMTMIGLFFLNSMGNSMLSTGAFEIYLDGKKNSVLYLGLKCFRGTCI